MVEADKAVKAVEDQMLETITTVQDTTLKVLKGWTDTLSAVPLPEFPPMPKYEMPKFETFFPFAEKLWATEKEFFVKLLDIATEAGKKAEGAVKKTADKAAAAAK
jgi:hypothetical protein